jgi:membrane associated rhomboid family serine protease
VPPQEIYMVDVRQAGAQLNPETVVSLVGVLGFYLGVIMYYWLMKKTGKNRVLIFCVSKSLLLFDIYMNSNLLFVLCYDSIVLHKSYHHVEMVIHSPGCCL